MAEAPDAEGEPGGYEELEPLIEKIRQQRRELVRNTRIRQEFTANVSHELKTPLTAISGYAELIETGLASERDIPGFAKGIHSSADRLLALINDILRLSELDDSETEMEFECLNLYELAKNCAEMLQVNAAKQGVEIQVEGEVSAFPKNIRKEFSKDFTGWIRAVPEGWAARGWGLPL